MKMIHRYKYDFFQPYFQHQWHSICCTVFFNYDYNNPSLWHQLQSQSPLRHSSNHALYVSQQLHFNPLSLYATVGIFLENMALCVYFCLILLILSSQLVWYGISNRCFVDLVSVFLFLRLHSILWVWVDLTSI